MEDMSYGMPYKKNPNDSKSGNTSAGVVTGLSEVSNVHSKVTNSPSHGSSKVNQKPNANETISGKANGASYTIK